MRISNMCHRSAPWPPRARRFGGMTSCRLHPARLLAFVASATWFTCAFDPAPAAAGRLFETPYVPLEAYGRPSHLVSADINGDGIPDIVHAGFTSNSYGDGHAMIGSLLGPAGTTMAAGRQAVDFWDAEGAPDVACADLNGDGRQDVVATVPLYGDDYRVWVGLGMEGTGGLNERGSYPIRAGATGLALGDVDGDGRVDVAVSHWWADSVAIFLGLGDGTLAAVPSLGVASSPRSLALGDLDGDARLDLVVGHFWGTASVLLGDGHGGFRPHATLSVGGQDLQVGLADLNGDGRLDLFLSGGVLLGDGAGGFGPMLVHGVAGAIAVGDFDRDSKPDLAIRSGAGLVVLRGNGDGSFVTGARYDIGGSDVIASDLDRDGDVDLAVANGAIVLMFGNGDGTFGRDVPSYPVGRFPGGIAAGDLNGDHHPDVVVANRESKSISILLGARDGRLAPGGELVTGFAPHDPVLEDFDRDGYLDLAIVELWLGTLSVRGGHGDGTFGPPATIGLPTGKASSLATADFDGDGFPDLAVADGSRTVWVWFGGADGIAPGGRHVAATMPVPGYRVAVGDVSGDGRLDLILQGDGVTYAPGRGDGTFAEVADWVPAPDYGYFYSLATIDLCNDCSHHALAAQYCCVTLHGGDEWHLDRVFGHACDSPHGGVDPGAPYHMVAGDLDGDGIDDLAMPGAVALGNGAGWFGSRQAIGIGGGAMAIADLNADGKRDLLLAQPGRDRILVLLNQGLRAGLPDVPRRFTAHAAAASIEFTWDAVDHPNLAGYRIHYDVQGRGGALAGTGAAEGPSPVAVPAGQTAFALSCLPESTYSVRVTAVDDLGRESRCAPVVSARPRPVDGEFALTGGSANGTPHGRWVMGRLQLEGPVSAADVVPGTVTLNGVGPGEHLGLTDSDHDGRQELKLRFPRSALEGIPPGAANRVEGLVPGCLDTLRFAVDDSVRIRGRRPRAQPMAFLDADTIADTPSEAHDGLEVVTARPTAFALHPVAPTPTPEGCTVAFDLPEDAAVRVQVFDLHGRMVSSLLERAMPAGAHQVWWDRAPVPDGIYFVRIEAGGLGAVRRIVLLRR